MNQKIKKQKKLEKKSVIIKSKYLIDKQKENVSNYYSFAELESLDKQLIYKNLGLYY